MNKIDFGPEITELLLDAKREYFRKAGTATNEREVDNAWFEYQREVARLIDLTNIGDGRSNCELDVAKRQYLDSLVAAKTRNDSTDARRKYEEEVVRIVNDHLPLEIGPADGDGDDADDEDLPELIQKADKQPAVVAQPKAAPVVASAPAPAPVVVANSPRITVQVLDSTIVPDDEREATPAAVLAEHATFTPAKEQEDATPHADIYTNYDRALGERWKEPPPMLKQRRKKGAR